MFYLSCSCVNKYLFLRKRELAESFFLHVLSEADVIQRLGHPVTVQHLSQTQGLVMHLKEKVLQYQYQCVKKDEQHRVTFSHNSGNKAAHTAMR